MASFKKWRDKRKNPWKAVFYEAIYRWRRERGQLQLYDYLKLPAGSIVFDFGGYKGEWTDIVLDQQPDSQIHVFEPHPDFAADLHKKYQGDDRVKVYDYALGSKEGKLRLSDDKNASSSVADGDKGVTGNLLAVDRFFKSVDVPKIDLVKMNIEGGEYDLLPAMIDAGVMPRVGRLQVQFHLFDEGMIALRDAIRAELENTHECVWCYPFVWEEWQLRS